jgi:hypothetical protein
VSDLEIGGFAGSARGRGLSPWLAFRQFSAGSWVRGDARENSLLSLMPL